ncbi:GNAT family protein [Amnibacterium sp. CER49]|uniref:GNAT family N-acetyltransferase n=1 Tax=Amnibacterium sp. CER49 TaxID=3039161 RepID=UPI00244A0654|nr:GNAT family protein [Amnibacterium sp. CER49]MDH2444213.1 GNAT family protein [Amnibacterium sp. CER49]
MAETWPGTGLLLRSPAVELAPMTAELLDALALLLPDDIELDPAVPLPPGEVRAARREAYRTAVRRDREGFDPDGWKLHLAVRLPTGALAGVQTIEAERFAAERTVDSASWLVPEARGRGIGIRMREAVLALAFGPLAADAAITSAWRDNAASLGVSRHLGYRYERTSRLVTPERDGELVHLRLSRAAWLASGSGQDVLVTGARPELFGTGP